MQTFPPKLLYFVSIIAYAVGENKFGECGYHSNKRSDRERKTFIKMQGLVNPLKQVRLYVLHCFAIIIQPVMLC